MRDIIKNNKTERYYVVDTVFLEALNYWKTQVYESNKQGELLDEYSYDERYEEQNNDSKKAIHRHFEICKNIEKYILV